MFEKLLLKIRNTYRNTTVGMRNKWIFKHKKLPKEVRYFEGSLYDVLYESALKHPYNTAIEYSDLQITYKQLIKKINTCARALKAFGIEKGDRVTICMPNTPEEVCMFYAINEIGAVANMIHPLSSEKEIEYYLNKSKSKLMLCIDVSYKKVKNIIDNTKVEKVIVVNATKSMERLTAFAYWLIKGRKMHIKEDKKFILWDHFISKASSYTDDPYEAVNSMDPCAILYSGGTTGKPKGVMLTNFAFNASALQARHVAPELLVPENAFLTFLPNFHCFGLGICTHIPLAWGMRVVLIPQFNAKKFKSYLRKYHFNILCGVPTLYDAITKMKFRKNELKGLKLVVSGGDAMSMPLKQKINEFLRANGCKTEIRIGYGLTESSGVVALCPEGVAEADTIGYPFPGTEFKILDINSGKEVPTGQDGEICISGPNLMLGYLDEPEETANTIFEDKNSTKWLHTGDIGYVDKKGLIHYRSRLKRMIITSGYNVYPSHVEDVIGSHDAVMRCAVIGVPNEARGEIVKAFIELKEGKDSLLIKNSIQKHMKEHLAKFEMPREIRYIDKMPVTLVGKVAFKELEKMD